LKYFQTNLDVYGNEYKREYAQTKREVRKFNCESWNKYVSDNEHNVCRAQSMAHKIMIQLCKSERDTTNYLKALKIGSLLDKMVWI